MLSNIKSFKGGGAERVVGGVQENKTSQKAEELARFTVMYAKASQKKHKVWEGDGILFCYADYAVVKSEDGKEVLARTTTLKNLGDLENGKVIFMSGLEVQIQEQVYLSKSASLTRSGSSGSPLEEEEEKRPESKKRVSQLLYKRAAMMPSLTAQVLSKQDGPSAKKPFLGNTITSPLSYRPFNSPLIVSRKKSEESPPFVIDESEEPRPVVPGRIAQHLRPHQKEGIVFIYKSLRDHKGCILADDMGLGKSIQTISAIWASMTRKGRRIQEKCLLVVPSSLVNNWKAEFRKWFDVHTRRPVIAVQKSADILSYANSTSYNPFLLISYDMALRYVEKLKVLKFDVIVCDEGHKLKNINGKLRAALHSLSIARRLILTGTPLQNDLDEFHSLLDFVRPNRFGNRVEFREMCRDKDSEFSALRDECMLRRISSVCQSHLPDKHEYVIFCKPSELQKKVLTAICEHMTRDPLMHIDYIRKLVNHPVILYRKLLEDKDKDIRSSETSLLASFPQDYKASIYDSGKLSTLCEILGYFKEHGERCVIASSFTKTLGMIESLCRSLGLRIFRLDGDTPVHVRQKIVNDFNNSSETNSVFLLSKKAGGAGLNLVGASRFVLFDSEWNPAIDLQAMARIWRDGQNLTCHIYRMATAGTIDEKMIQRQIRKGELGSVVEQLDFSSNVKFRDEDLEDIFTFVDSPCNTHDILDCDCQGKGLLPGEIDEEAEEEIEGENDENLQLDNEEESLEDFIAQVKEKYEEYGQENGDEDGFSSKVDEKEQEHEGEEENQEESNLGGPSLLELFRWRHYSPAQPSHWLRFKASAGFSTLNLFDVSFAFHYIVKPSTEPPLSNDL